MNTAGLELRESAHLPSPSLLVWPDRVQANLDAMIDLVGGDLARLRPHVKTHKMAAVVRMQLKAGIEKFKAATIAEVEMCLDAGAVDVLLAYPLVGPNRERLATLATRFPEARLQFLAEEREVLGVMNSLCKAAEVTLGVFVDLDCGMHRTGTERVATAMEVAKAADEAPYLSFSGVHAYDGHVRAGTVNDREADWSSAMDSVKGVIDALAGAGLAVDQVVGGGSPTYGFHAAQRGWQCSPGTTLFWDAGYGSNFPDLPFVPAAAVLTRVISKPGVNRLCLDLGHKAIASENALDQRVDLIGLEDATPVGHSEEHLVLEADRPERFAIGEAYLGVPYHICPTVALHQEAHLIEDGVPTGERWEVTARNRRLTV